MTFGVTADDDSWHEPSSGDPFWTETLWLRFAVPDRNLTGILYAIFRPNQRVASLFAYLWDRAAATEDTALYVHRAFHLPLPEDLRDVRLPGGFSYRCIEPLAAYDVHYDDGVELRIDLRYTGVHPPVGRGPNGTTTSYFQPSRVIGSMRLNGDEVQVDCYELRGSAWNVRPDLRSPPRPDDLTRAIGHADTYAASTDTTFFMGSAGNLSTTSFHSGFFMRDGEIQQIVEGRRTVQRNDVGYTESIDVEAQDEAGRSFHAVGTCVNQLYIPMPSYAMWSNGVQWDVDGESMWGGDDDVPGGRPARRLHPSATRGVTA
jgi:hypothetical protein